MSGQIFLAASKKSLIVNTVNRQIDRYMYVEMYICIDRQILQVFIYYMYIFYMYIYIYIYKDSKKDKGNCNY